MNYDFKTPKTPAQSKTLWVNFLAGVISLATLAGGAGWIQAYPQLVAGIGVVYAALNGFLRVITSEPIQMKKPEDK